MADRRSRFAAIFLQKRQNNLRLAVIKTNNKQCEVRMAKKYIEIASLSESQRRRMVNMIHQLCSSGDYTQGEVAKALNVRQSFVQQTMQKRLPCDTFETTRTHLEEVPTEHDEPTATARGTVERVMVYRRRYAQNKHLFHPEDSTQGVARRDVIDGPADERSRKKLRRYSAREMFPTRVLASTGKPSYE